jgi:kynurenine formamidase
MAAIERSNSMTPGNASEPISLSRRRFLERSLAGLAAAVISSAVTAETAVAATHRITTDDDIERLLPQLSNWGRWGKDDQLGTLNYITPQTRLRAVALIKTGQAIPLGREISPANTKGLRKPKYELHRYEDPLPEEAGCIDYIGMIYHGFAVTHIDALCHIFTPEGKNGMYNGFPISEVTSEGANRLGIEHAGRHGIAGRGVLLDVAALKGGPLAPGSVITPNDLEGAERAEAVAAGEGDVLFIRNGAGAANTYELGTGLHPDCLAWMHERRIAVVSSDSDSDVHPRQPGFQRWSEPVHMIAIPYMGLPILDNTDLEELSLVCAAERRWEFFVTASPWRFRGATSSPVNPLAIF